MTDVKHNLFQRGDGRWVLAYAPDGNWKRPKQVTAPKDIRSKKDADGWLKQRLAELRAGGGLLPEKSRGLKTLADVHETLMKVRESHPDTKPATLKNNRSHLSAQILSEEANADPASSIAHVPMASVDVARGRAFVRAVRSRCSPNHTRNIFSTVRMLWDVAIGEKIITTANPFRNSLVQKEVPKAQSLDEIDGEVDPITIPLPVVEALFGCDDVPEERRVRYAIAVTTGADDGEIAGLTFRRIQDGCIQIREALAIRGEDGFATISTPKTPNRLRDVPIHPAAGAALRDWRDVWERLACRKPLGGDFVFAKFTKKHGAEPWRPLSASFVRKDLRALNAAAMKAGGGPVVSEDQIARIDFKAFRRTFSSALRAAGVDEETRGQLLGHSGASVTARNYTAHQIAVLAEQVGRIPLVWPSVHRSVRTNNSVCTNPGLCAPYSSETTDRISEARTGLEPVCDGFAKQCLLCSDRSGSPCDANAAVVPSPTSVGTASAIGTDSGGSGLACTTAKPIVKAAYGCRAIRVEVDGGVIASTSVAEGEPIADVEARLVLAARQRRSAS